MKRIIKYLLLAILFYSCSKKETGTNESSFQYKVDGQLVTIDFNIAQSSGAVFARQMKSDIVPAARYQLNAQKGLNDVFIASIYTDDLKKGTYRYDSLGLINFNLTINSILSGGAQSMLYYSTDYLEFNFTSVSKSSASGTFSGKFTPVSGGLDYNNRSTVIISDGKFTNTPIIN